MRRTLLMTAAIIGFAAGHAHAQSIGTQDNFDTFNDTGSEAEGFEVDLDGAQLSDITRVFGATYIRYGDPSVTAYDNTASGGSKGVAIVWAAQWTGSAWQTANSALGNGTPYVANPTISTGESCWTYGYGAAYPTAGCEHFGISLTSTAAVTATNYHWLIADPANPGTLVKFAQAATLPTLPNYNYIAPSPVQKLPVVKAVIEAPERADKNAHLWSDAVWMKAYISQSIPRDNLDALQTGAVPVKSSGKTKVTTAWVLLQRSPSGQPGEKLDIENDTLAKGKSAVTMRYEFYKYGGQYDSSSHEANCGGNGSCNVPVAKGLNHQNELGQYIGAHMVGANAL
jgi:hypothetical protein